MTIKEYIDEIKIRLSRIGITRDLDDMTLATYVNRARQQVQRFVMPITPDRYGKRKTFTIDGTTSEDNDYKVSIGYSNKTVDYWRFPLPDDYIDAEVCILEWEIDEVIYRSEARQATKFELFNNSVNAFNVPSNHRPVYTTENLLAHSNLGYPLTWSGKHFYISPGNITDLIAKATNIKVELWYKHSIYDLDYWLNDNDQVTPYYLDELVINFACQLCLRNISDERSIDSVEAESGILKKMIQELYTVQTDVAEQFMPSKEI